MVGIQIFTILPFSAVVGNKERWAVLLCWGSAAGIWQERGGRIGRNRLHWESLSVRLVSCRNGHSPAVGTVVGLVTVSAAVVAGLANHLSKK